VVPPPGAQAAFEADLLGGNGRRRRRGGGGFARARTEREQADGEGAERRGAIRRFDLGHAPW
jgi:hypothetical protein